MAAPTSPQSNLGWARLLETGEFSDLTITCRGRPFLVHRAILCPQSKTIANMCNSGMKESTTRVIEHEHFDADTLWCMIKFAYEKKYEVTTRPQGFETDDVEEGEESDQDEVAAQNAEVEQEEVTITGELESPSTKETEQIKGVSIPSGNDTTTATVDDEDSPELTHVHKWITHARVYALADCYAMPELRTYALDRFRAEADEPPIWDDPAAFIAVVKEVGKLTSQEGEQAQGTLRSELLELVSRNAKYLAADTWFITHLRQPGLHDIMADMFRVLGHRIMKDGETTATEANTLKAAIEGLNESLEHVKKECEGKVGDAESRVRASRACQERV